MTKEQAALKSIHLQLVGLQAQLASLEFQVRTALGEVEATQPPKKVATVSEEIRKAFSPPSAEESRENVFMRRNQAVEVPDLVSAPSSTVSASGTPNGRNPSAPSD